ncbi:MAG: hypothetical protein E6Q32_09045 [Neisseriales bacterium]|nr:MAG: hypothetical protein E6Q32_09045 [Neisseriales bacterium]
MRYSSVSAALFGLYNWSRQCEVKAMDYQIVFGIKSTLPKDTIKECIVQSRRLIKSIEELCDTNQRAILEYRYGFKDRFGQFKCLDDVAKIAYSGNIHVGELIAQNWRDNKVIIHELKSVFELEKRQVYNIINDAKSNLELVNLNFINNKYPLFCQIEEILVVNQLLEKIEFNDSLSLMVQHQSQ